MSMTFYRAQGGPCLMTKGLFGAWFYAPDGVHFYELGSAGLAAQGDREEATVTDASGRATKLLRRKDEVLFRNTVFRRGPGPPAFEIVRLPESDRDLGYAFLMADGRTILVTQSRHHFDYDTMRMFMGNLPKLSEVKISNVVRYRDGGTTVISTVNGELFSPSRLTRSNQKATWTPTGGESIALKAIDPRQFKVDEVSDRLLVTIID